MKTILVGYDGTEEAQVALDRTVTLAKAFDSRVVVASVASILISGGRSMGAVDPIEDTGDHQAMLDEALAKLSSQGVAAEGKLAIGNPPEAIVAAADEAGANLIVVGSRDLGFFERWMGGSVSDGVVHRAHCDVLIVH